MILTSSTTPLLTHTSTAQTANLCIPSPSGSLGRDLDRDVTDREEQSSGDAFGDRECAEPPPERKRDDGGSGCRSEPQNDLEGRATGALTGTAARQRHRQREQTEHRHEYADKLVAAETTPSHPSRDEGEDADPSRGDALNEGQRRERKRGDVEREAAGLEREAGHPTAIGQERLHGVKRPPKRKSGQSGCGIVLAQVRDVRQRGGRERQQECDGCLRTQSCRLLWQRCALGAFRGYTRARK